MKHRYIITKVILAKNAKDALKREKEAEVKDVFRAPEKPQTEAYGFDYTPPEEEDEDE